MRRYWREPQPPRMFHGGELPRMMSGILMLAVLYMLYTWMRDANSWRWMANDGSKSSPTAKEPSPQTPQPAPTVPAPTGVTDEDRDEAETARDEFQVVTDGGLTLQVEEMVPYDRLVAWAKHQSYARLRQRARTDLLFTNFYDEPDKYRGQLVTLEMNVRRILDAGKNRDGIQLYEVWGYTSESRDRLYVAIVVDLPKGMPIGPSVYEKARFAGYFFKLQGYQSTGAKSGAVPEKSPLLIGQLEWEPVVAIPVDDSQEWRWGLPLLAVIGAVLGLRFVYYRWIRRKPETRPSIVEAADGEVIPIDAWLERSDFGAEDDRNNIDKEND